MIFLILIGAIITIVFVLEPCLASIECKVPLVFVVMKVSSIV